MTESWATVPIGELCEVYDGPHATPAKTDDGPVFLGISNLSGGRLRLADAEHVSEEDFRRWTRRVTPRADDIVFSYETRLGEAARIPGDLKCCLGRRLGLLRAKSDRVDSRFLLYAYLGPQFQAVLHARTMPGSTVERIFLTDLPAFPIRVPSLPAQRAIGRLLGYLDDKIDLTEDKVDTLEEIARTLFRSWFVDFDPVRDTASVPDDIRRLFPDRFMASPFGQMPEGWTSAALGEFISVSRVAVDPRDHPDEVFDHYSIPAFDAGRTPAQDGGSDIKSHKLTVPDGCVLLSRLNPRFQRVWWPSHQGPRRKIASTEFVVALPAGGITRAFLYALFDSTPFQKLLSRLSTARREVTSVSA